jgi:hypothetical protein
MLKSVCFFLTSGRTFTFRQAEIVQDNETTVSVKYVAMSDGRPKTVTFYKANIAGISLDSGT